MRNIIKKILKEDFDWTSENTWSVDDLPINELERLVDYYDGIHEIKNKLSNWLSDKKGGEVIYDIENSNLSREESYAFNNLNLLKKLKTSEEMADLIVRSLKYHGFDKSDLFRVHEAGDFYSQTYFDAWMEVARRVPTTLFYAYTVSLPFWIARRGSIPRNFKLIASWDDSNKDLIEQEGLRYARVVSGVEEARELGLRIDVDDMLAWGTDESFALPLHGSQPKGTEAADIRKQQKKKDDSGKSFDDKIKSGKKINQSYKDELRSRIKQTLKGERGDNLNEGRYDLATGNVVKDIMLMIKNTSDYPLGEFVNIELPYGINGEDEYSYGGITFSVEINIVRTDEYGDWKIDSFRISNEDTLEFNIAIDPKVEELSYEKIYYKLQEDVRHEIEHLTQHGTYRMEDKPERTESSDDETTYEHHKKLDEIPALVHGFYRRAKSERRPLDEIMIDDLDTEIKNNKLTKSQAEELFKLWMTYAKRRLPKAIYSKS